jgi:uncharacterized membrane protein YhaH (DUF805 family)
MAAADRLVLEGDTTRRANAHRQKAIWEASPTNKVYFHNYLSSLLADYDAMGTNAAERYAVLAAEIETGRAVDPDNARLDFVQAAKLLEQAVESKTSVTGVTPDGKAKVRSEQVIKDRARLVEAMTLMDQGLKKPVYRRYVGDMLAARLAILGKPRSLSDQMLQLNLAADTPMPDLPLMRNLSRGAGAYAALLIAEKKPMEARPYLEVWKPLALRLTGDSFALLDVLMAAAMVKEAELRVPELYQQIGLANKAGETRAETRALTAPLVAWNTQRNAFQKDPAVRQQREAFSRHTGILATMLLPALTEYPTAAELAPSRVLDYILIEDLCFTVVSILMLLAMLAGVVRLRRIRRKLNDEDLTGRGALWRQAAARSWWCVGLPVLVYLVITRFTGCGGRLYGLPYVWPRLIFQLETLGVMMILLDLLILLKDQADDTEIVPPVLKNKAFSAYCGGSGFVLTVLCLLAGLVGAAVLIPVDWLTAERRTAAMAAMLAPVTVLVLAVICLALRRMRDPRQTTPAGRYERVTVATLALGLSVLVLTFGARGVLRIEERQCVRQETLLTVDPSIGGFTVAEARLAQALREQVLKAAQ